MRARQARWFDVVAERVNEVVARLDDVELEGMISADEFQSLFAMAMQAAIKTAYEEKLQALAPWRTPSGRTRPMSTIRSSS